jgi:hypothetical protein
MFIFSKLGRMGRFGNQLFQIAGTIAIARKNNHQYAFPKWEHAPSFRHSLQELDTSFVADLTVHQSSFRFIDITLAAPQEYVIDLNGFFQSERYFEDSGEFIRTVFAPSNTVLTNVMSAYGDWLGKEPTCALQVRRGDFAKYPHYHPMQTPEYYARAMASFPKDTVFLVSSDEIEWCKVNIKAKRVVYMPSAEPILSFFAGTLCDHAIISNSSFGWWMAWLNRNSNPRIIAPKAWLGSLWDLDTRDLIPSRWTCM